MKINKFSPVVIMYAVGAAMASCSGGSSGGSTDKLVHIDWDAPIDDRVIDIHDYADIEYIPLETTDESVFNVGFGFGISDSLIAVADNIGNRALIFDREGKYMHDINRYGGGPEEYPYMTDGVFDMERGDVYIVCSIGNRNIYTYDFDGKFKKKSGELGRDNYISGFSNLDGDKLIAWDSGGLQMEPLEDNKEKYRYVLVDKSTGQFEPIPLAVEHPVGTSQTFNLGGGMSRGLTIGLQPIVRSHDGFVISDFASDTLYEYSAGRLEPLAVFENISRSGRRFPDRVSVDFATGRYVGLTYTRILDVTMDEISVDEKVSGNYLLDRKTGEVFRYRMDCPYLKEGPDWTPSYRSISGPANTYAFTVTAERLHENLEDGLLRPELEAMVKQLDEDANPVVVIMKFKE